MDTLIGPKLSFRAHYPEQLSSTKSPKEVQFRYNSINVVRLIDGNILSVFLWDEQVQFTIPIPEALARQWAEAVLKICDQPIPRADA